MTLPVRVRRLLWGGGLLAVLGIVGGVGWAYGRHHLVPRRFHVVEPGIVYRGARQEYGPYRRIIEQHDIRTIITLLDDVSESHTEQVEARILADLPVRRLRFEMPGDGLGDLGAIEAAAAAVANPELQPVFVHCSAGVNRTGAVIAAYRMLHCGWSFERAMEEMDRRGASFRKNPELYEHMVRFHQER